MGFERNLSAGEILEQVLYFARWVRDNVPGISRHDITNVVFMGMGEPLANYDNVMQAVATLNAKWGLGLGVRQITVSTGGLAPQIRRLAEESLHVELAVSLHAPDNALRNQLMPINRRYSLAELMAACGYFFDKTGRRPTFEYALFEGINDSLEHAASLAKLLNGLNCSVNLITGNPTPCADYRPSSRREAVAFRDILTARGITSTIRLSRGADIEAGCGQLRSRWQRETKSASEQPSTSR
jgi:23S rRNA (adenine2503-C2)-methyltransferase